MSTSLEVIFEFLDACFEVCRIVVYWLPTETII